MLLASAFMPNLAEFTPKEEAFSRTLLQKFWTVPFRIFFFIINLPKRLFSVWSVSILLSSPKTVTLKTSQILATDLNWEILQAEKEKFIIMYIITEHSSHYSVEIVPHSSGSDMVVCAWQTVSAAAPLPVCAAVGDGGHCKYNQLNPWFSCWFRWRRLSWPDLFITSAHQPCLRHCQRDHCTNALQNCGAFVQSSDFTHQRKSGGRLKHFIKHEY